MSGMELQTNRRMDRRSDHMVPTDHDIPFSRTFQGLLRYIFKDFSRTFLHSFKHPFAKKWSTMDFSNNTYRDHLILSSPENGGRGGFGYVYLTFLDDLLHYGYNTASNNSAWKGGLKVLPQKNFIRISTKSCNSRQFWSGGYTSLVIMSQ